MELKNSKQDYEAKKDVDLQQQNKISDNNNETPGNKKHQPPILKAVKTNNWSIGTIHNIQPTTSTFDCILIILRIIILASCVVLTLITFPTFLTLILSYKISLPCLIEFILLIIQIILGFYATLKKNRTVLIIFCILSGINTIFLITILVSDTIDYGVGSSNSSSGQIQNHTLRNALSTNNLNKTFDFNSNDNNNQNLSFNGGKSCKIRYGCEDDSINCFKTCCHSLDLGCKFSRTIIIQTSTFYHRQNTSNTTTNKPNGNGKDNLILYVLLWFIAWYCLLLFILSFILSVCGIKGSRQQQPDKTILNKV